jgi:hypothetical protein
MGDLETKAINTILDELSRLDPDSQERILAYITARLATDWDKEEDD